MADDYDRPLFYRVASYAAGADRDVVDMVSGNPDWDPPEALREGLREYADGDADAFQYPPSHGLAGLRRALAERRGLERGEDAAERVVVTNGAGEANYLATACGLAAHDGDEVLLTDPVYPYYPSRADLLGADVRQVPVEDDGGLDPGRVREAASEDTAVIVVNSPNNPTGAVYPERTLRELVAVAERYGALLVSDEVYDHYDYSGRFASALAVDSPNRAVVNSFSKSMAVTGLRVGYLVVPRRLADAVRRRHMLVNVTGARPAQYAVLKALRETPASYYERNCERVRDRVERFTEGLDDAGAEYSTPRGGFYVMARFPELAGSLENTKRLIDEAGVAGMPGETFGDSRAEWFRFALVTPHVEEAAERLADYFA